MRYWRLWEDGPEISELGLGCAAVLGRVGRRDSLSALHAAWDSGITLYDTARSYGYGESESLLGEFFAGKRRKDAVICTKFGILPAPQNWKRKIKPLAQTAVRLFPGIRRAVQRQAANQLKVGEFSVGLLERSLETSLRALRTDYVDMLLLHAAPMSAIENDDVLEALERLVKRGTVRMAGVSGEYDVIAASFARKPRGLETAQFAMNAGAMSFASHTREAAKQGWFLVANQPFAGVAGAKECRRRIERMRGDADLPSGLRAKLETDEQVMPEAVLNMILRGTGVHAAIPAMMRPEHVAANVRAIDHCRFTDEELQCLRQALAEG